MPRLHKSMNSKNGKRDNNRCVQVTRISRNTCETRCATSKLEAKSGVNVNQDNADDLCKAQGNDGQVITTKTQCWNTNNHTHKSSANTAEQKANNKKNYCWCGAGSHGLSIQSKEWHHANNKDCAGITTNGHKASVTQRKLSKISGNNVQRNGHQNIDADLLKNNGLIARNKALSYQEVSAKDKECNKNCIDGIASRHSKLTALTIFSTKTSDNYWVVVVIAWIHFSHVSLLTLSR